METGTSLFQLVETEVLRVRIPVPQYYFSRIHVGTPVQMQFDALPEYNLDAAVTMKIPVSSETGRTFPVRIEINNEDRRIAPGMSARVRLRLEESTGEEALLLPRDTIVHKPDGSTTVWVIEDGGEGPVARPTPVSTGRAFKGNVAILDGGIRPGDRVVVRGNEILEPGQPVRIHREVDMEL